MDNAVHFRDRPDQRSIAGIALLAHEVTHARQYRSSGIAPVFLALYSANTALVLGTLPGAVISAIAAYRDGRNLPREANLFEQAAESMQQRVSDDLTRRFQGRDPCP